MNSIITPCFVMQSKKLQNNLNRLVELERATGVKILHTLKSFNQDSVLPTIGSILSGMSISTVDEFKMAKIAHAQHLHLYVPAYKEEVLTQLAHQVSTLSFNSMSQWERFKNYHTKTSVGLRINPKLHLPIPSYCNPNLSQSRLGIDYLEFLEHHNANPKFFLALEGLHFHALYQSSAEGVWILLDHISTHYQQILPRLKWINLGGGHNFTDKNYDTKHFISTVQTFNQKHPHIQLYFEPGESVVKDTGDFICTVLDITTINGVDVTILDTSIETHLLDVAIVNQRLKVQGTQNSSTPYYYELAGNSCLQGDTIGEYFFQMPLSVGDKIIFEDMMGYSMVKTTQFNGMELARFVLN
ncbi:MAG TPA: hypothetical protein EYG67_01490 [Campylobacterales bacterium]|nr:hypothetical protein [Campylobacterales bacterium]HIP41172.1 hypothetical protein [Campylobacterales bacterium]